MVPIYIVIGYYLLSSIGADGFAILLTLPMLTLVVVNLYAARRQDMTFWEMTWFCAYLFFVIGPVQSIQDRRFQEGSPVAGFSFSEGEMVAAMLIPTLFFLVLTAFSIRRPARHDIQVARYEFSREVMIVFVVINIAAFVGNVAAAGSFANLLAARYDKEDFELGLLGGPMTAVQCVTFFLVLLYWMRRKSDLASAAMVVVVVALMAIFQNPYNSARYFLVTTYLPALLILLKGRLRVSQFYGFSIGAMVFLMPVLNITSRLGGTITEAIEQIEFKDLIYRLPFLDVFDTLVYFMIYMKNNDFFFGGKTLGIILFFVPRSIWTNKPTLLGLDLGKELLEQKLSGTDNLSFFIGGDFYGDLGYIGVVVGAFVTGYMMRRVGTTNRTMILGQDLVAYILLSSIPILMRGPVAANTFLITSFMGTLWLSLFLAHQRETLGGRGPALQKVIVS